MKDLLKAHGIMMSALVDEAGVFRTGGVGVFKGKKVVHIASPAKQVPRLMTELFAWLKNAEDHLLVKSCVFHYEFEFIHPFADGNGRIGRLWQSLILAKLHPVFQHLPVETMVHDNQAKYYDAINRCSKTTDSSFFIDFMLGEILHALMQHRGDKIGGVTGGVTGGVNQVLALLKQHPGCRSNMIAMRLKLPLRTIQRCLAQLKKQEKIEFQGAPRNGGYYLKK